MTNSTAPEQTTGSMVPFDVTAPLPRGITLLEASAGTGKTWTIAALVARWVAEGEATLDQLLVVTFGRAASQELRDRVRERLVQAERAVREAAAGIAPTTSDSLLLHLLNAEPEELARRAGRLQYALSTFDAATIATIHQFCQQVLRSLGVAGDTDTSAVLVEDLSDLLVEVSDDLYLARWADAERPPFTRSEALILAREAVADTQATLEPAEVNAETAGEWPKLHETRVLFAREVRVEMDRRKRRLGLLSYDDLLHQLAEALRTGEDAGLRMRHRWKVALIDEFQDTDPVQWQVFDRAFGHSEDHTMVLIGDPKQAIYAFRGGDVMTYLSASARATTQQTLAHNHRSDRALVERVDALLNGAELGESRIVVHPVTAVIEGSRLHGAGDPFRLRVVERDQLRRGKVGVADYRAHVFADVAADIKRLLASGATYDHVDGTRPIAAADIAVIAGTNAHLQAIQAELHRIGVPAVVSGNESVFRTSAAREWLVLLEALEQPQRSDRVRAAALTPFLGHEVGELDRRGDELTDQLAALVRNWADLLGRRGIAAVIEAATAGGMTARVLSQTGGERLLTDLRHIGQVLHEVESAERLGPVALATWLRTQMSQEKLEISAERTRRLDSDAAAVQLVTVHRSKGLEYPVVYLPGLWDRHVRDPQVALFHAADTEGGAVSRRRDVGGPGSPVWRQNVATHLHEDAGESLRLLYVALTRAQCQVVAWYASAWNTPTSPLHRVLFGRRPGAASVPDQIENADQDKVTWVLAEWHKVGGPQIERAEIAPVDQPLPTVDHPLLQARTFSRRIDTGWKRNSYSSLSSVVDHQHGAGVLSEPEESVLTDEPSEIDDADLASTDLAGADVTGGAVRPMGDHVPSPMADLPMGAGFGSLVHAVLEHADPAAPERGGDFAADLAHHVADQVQWWGVEVDPETLVNALVAVCDTPMGPLADDLTLRDFSMRDRLRELDFEVPLAGGDQPVAGRHEVRLGDLAPILLAHLPEGDPVRGYVTQLEDPVLAAQPLRGYLTGSIDVVLRVGEGADQRFLTVDYKTNWLGGTDRPLTAEQYRPEALDEAMAHSDYPLQALLYTVVLHRFLRWRLPDYDPEVHLGGVLYLYLRGMCGPETPTHLGMPCGVFSWRPPVALVHALSDLLDGDRRPHLEREGA